jgi:hypothetical protein
MRIQVNSRRGNFNLINPLQESVSTNIVIKKGKEVLMACSITTDDIVETNDPLELKEKIEDYLNSLLFTTQRAELEGMIKFLEENQEELRKAEL